MNQSILFPDLQSWDETKQGICFPAQHSGQSIECFISLERLVKLGSASINGKAQALQVFDELRFDIEELAEELIEDESFNSQGQIEI